MRLRPILLLCGVSLVLACEHSDPFDSSVNREPRGPFPANQVDSPRQITFSTGDDRMPSLSGGALVYTQEDLSRSDGDHCVAMMPALGGTVVQQWCRGGLIADDVKHVRAFPTLSPDSAKLAFVEEESNHGSRILRVMYLGEPDSIRDFSTSAIRLLAPVNDFRDPYWVSSTQLRFLAGIGGFNSNTRDTTFVSSGMFDLDVETGEITLALLVRDAYAIAGAPIGGTYLLRAEDSTAVWHANADGELNKVEFDWSNLSLLPGVNFDIAGVEDDFLLIARVLPPVFEPTFRNIILRMPSDRAPLVDDLLWEGDVPRNVEVSPDGSLLVAEIVRFGESSLWLFDIF